MGTEAESFNGSGDFYASNLTAISHYHEHLDKYWIFCQTVTCVTASVLFWLVVCLICFGKQSGKFRKLNSPSKENYDGGVVYLYGLIAVVSGLFRLASTEAFLFYHLTGGAFACNVTLNLNTVTYSLMNIFLYIFLWLRQRSFYAHPRFSAMANNWVNYISIGIMVLVAIAGPLMVIMFVLLRHFDYTDEMGCMVSKLHKRPYEINYGVFALHLIGQTTLLALFTYPLVKSAPKPKQHYESEVVDDKTTSVASHRSTHSTKNWRKVSRMSVMRKLIKSDNVVTQAVRRTTVCTILSLVGELTAMICSIFIKGDNGRANIPISTSIFNLNLVLNGVVVVASFTTWKRILTSPFNIGKKRMTQYRGSISSYNPRCSCEKK